MADTLELALKTLWNKKLYTVACCAGHLLGERHFYFSSMYSYLVFENGIDVFKFLSDELVSNPCVMLMSNTNQAIYFYGKDKDALMIKFINDIMMKKEINSKYLNDKLNKPIDQDVKYKIEHDYYIASGYTEEEYSELKHIDRELLLLKEDANYTYVDEAKNDVLLNRIISIKNEVYQRKLSKKKRGR